MEEINRREIRARLDENLREWVDTTLNCWLAPDGLVATPETVDQFTEILECRARELTAHLSSQLRVYEEALQLNSPWPVRDVLLRLAGAADHLLRDHNCDTLGWEGIGVARDQAYKIASALASPDPQSGATKERCSICQSHGCPTCHGKGDRCPCARDGRT